MISSAAKLISEKTSFLITTHMSPDGDALGSASAMMSILRNMGKDVTLYLSDRAPDNFTFLNGILDALPDIPARRYDTVIAVDCANIDRIGPEFAMFNGYDTLINIDHHKGNSDFGDINIVDKNICSAGMLVCELAHELGVEIDRDMAAAIYTSILVDSGSFHYSNASADAFRVAAEMIDTGVNAWDIAEKVYESQPVNRINLLKRALATLETHIEDGFAAMTVTREILKETDADLNITDGFINYPRSIKGVEIALLFKELDGGRYKLSLRSRGKADVSRIAGEFGGGGHKNAAGCIFNGNIDEIKTKVFSCIKDYLKQICD